MSAGTQLRKARDRLAYVETELLKLQIAAAQRTDGGRARSLLRQLLPYAKHKTGCSRECDCDLAYLRDEIDALLDASD